MDTAKQTSCELQREAMFADVVRALVRRSGTRYGLLEWVSEHEPFLMMEMLEAQDEIAKHHRENDITIEDFGNLIQKRFWSTIKEAITRYDDFIRNKTSKEAGVVY